MWGNNLLNWISLYLLNRLGNPNFSINDVKSVNEILEMMKILRKSKGWEIK